MPPLAPLVTTAVELDPVELAETYILRRPAPANVVSG